MDVLASPARAMVWVCPECGHGSPEPRDERAHLDAHRQLHQFFREWDEAVDSDARAAASRARWRSPRVWVVAILVVCVSALVSVRLSGGEGASRRPAAPGALIPGVDLPRHDAFRAVPPVQEGSSPATGPADAAPPAHRPFRSSAPTRPVPDVPVPVDPAPADRAPVDGLTADTGAAPGSAAPRPSPAASGHLIHTCLLGLVCITVL